MKAIITEKYGSPDVLKFEEVQKPAPKDNELLVKVQAAAANAGDWHLLRGDPFIVRLMFGLLKPKIKILGVDVAGRVEAVGSNVTQFQPGDEVFGDLSGGGYGAFAEYVAVPEGIYVMVGGGTAQFLQAMLLSMTGNKKMVTFIKKTNQADLVVLKELLEAGQVAPVIDRCYPLNETPAAIRYLEQGHASGKVVVTVN